MQARKFLRRILFYAGCFDPISFWFRMRLGVIEGLVIRDRVYFFHLLRCRWETQSLLCILYRRSC